MPGPAFEPPGADSHEYTSVPCHLGDHATCTHGVARPCDPDLPVIFQICSCFCHRGDDS